MFDVAVSLANSADVAARRRGCADRATLLSGVGLFDNLGEGGLAGFAPAFERVELAPGEVLWRQATAHDGLYVLLRGEVEVCRRLPGERELELARVGPGEVIGEVPLLGGGNHSATVRAVDRCSLLFLSREEFEARTISAEPSALELRRRIVAIACARLRRTLAALAEALGGDASHDDLAHGKPWEGESSPAATPPHAYLSRLALFRRLHPDLVAQLVDRAAVLSVARGRVLQREGAHPKQCHIVLNGAVEDVLHRGASTLRVGFCGPGHAIGYVGLLDGGPSPVCSVTRERCVILAVDRRHFAELQSTPVVRSRGFAAAIEANVIRSLEIAERTLSHMATVVPA